MSVFYSWVIPIKNEAESLSQLIKEIKLSMKGKSFEIIAINDASDDNTANILESLAYKTVQLQIINFAAPRGKWAAISVGFKKAIGSVIITIDSDLQDDPRQVWKLIDKLNQGYDLVSGWRKVRYDSFYKVWFSKLGNLLASVLTRKPLKDLNSPFKVYKKKVLGDLPQSSSLLRFTMLFADSLGYKISEVAVEHRPRLFGKSKFGIWKYIKIIFDLILVLLFLFDFGKLRRQVRVGIRRLVTYLVVGSSFAFLSWNILKNWSSISSLSWQLGPADLFALTLLILLIQGFNIFSWHLITKAVGGKISLLKNSRVWIFSNLSRFLPGAFWQYISRVYLTIGAGAARPTALLATAIEPIFNLLAGSLVLVITLFFWHLPLQVEPSLIILALLPLVIILFSLNNQKVLTKLVSLVGDNSRIGHLRLSTGWILALVLVFIVHFILAGLTIFLVASNILGGLDSNLIPAFVGVFTASWLVGYIAVFVPAGLGVMEVTLAGLLSFYIPLSVASLTAVLFRFLLLIGEALVFLFIFYKYRND